MATPEPSIDGSAFYQYDNLHTMLYDTLYGNSIQGLGDLAWYDALATHTGPAILDAACGTGRVFAALAKPGRRIHAFDASPALLQQARVRAATLAPDCSVQLSQQRLESFSFAERFDLILLPYYSFGNLLDATSRQSCLQCIAAHLKPGGRAVIHLPAAELLRREVPAQELAQMRARYRLAMAEQPGLLVEQRVLAMEYLEARNLRVMHINAALLRDDGSVLKQHPATLFYACLTAEQMTQEAASAGLHLANVRHGFFKKSGGVDTELVLVLTARNTAGAQPA